MNNDMDIVIKLRGDKRVVTRLKKNLLGEAVHLRGFGVPIEVAVSFPSRSGSWVTVKCSACTSDFEVPHPQPDNGFGHTYKCAACIGPEDLLRSFGARGGAARDITNGG